MKSFYFLKKLSYCLLGGLITITAPSYAEKMIAANGILLFVGDGGAAFYSSDGSHWANGSVHYKTGDAPVGSFDDVAYIGGNTFVAIDGATKGTVAYNAWRSTDNGKTWSTQYGNGSCEMINPCLPFTPHKIYNVNGTPIILADDYVPWYSDDDGQSWKNQNSNEKKEGQDFSLAYDGNNTVVIVRQDEQGYNAWDYAYSTDKGKTWAGAETSGQAVLYDVAYAKDPANPNPCIKDQPCIKTGMFAIAASDTTILISSNGVNWSPAQGLGNYSDVVINKIRYDANLHRWIAPSEGEAIFYSSDGINWTNTTEISGSSWDSLNMIAINATDGSAITTSSADNYCMYQSTDGIKWDSSKFDKDTLFCKTPISIVWNPKDKNFYAAVRDADEIFIYMTNPNDSGYWLLVGSFLTDW